MPDLRSVFSSTVDKIGYDEATQELTVFWKKGKTSVYSGVPAGKASQVMNAPSVGQALHEQVKGAHPHSYR